MRWICLYFSFDFLNIRLNQKRLITLRLKYFSPELFNQLVCVLFFIWCGRVREKWFETKLKCTSKMENKNLVHAKCRSRKCVIVDNYSGIFDGNRDKYNISFSEQQFWRYSNGAFESLTIKKKHYIIFIAITNYTKFWSFSSGKRGSSLAKTTQAGPVQCPGHLKLINI